MKFKTKIFADGANLEEMLEAYRNGTVQGFTTNPTLMRKAGITDYPGFCKKVLAKITEMPISFEVFSDEINEMAVQATEINRWGGNVFVKIPVTNTRGESTARIVRSLSAERVKLNVTAILSLEQVQTVHDALDPSTPAIVSVFAGRIADTGRDPVPIMKKALQILKSRPKAELLWASPREVLNIAQAEEIGCPILTVTPDLLKKIPVLGKSLEEMSLDTVKMFYNDAKAAGYQL